MPTGQGDPMPTAPDTSLGVHLLETITLGMYSEPLHCVREYIQNAFDSIRVARRLGLLGPEDGRIDVLVDRDARLLRIRDNGTGLGPEEASVRLVDIGYSSKASTTDGAATNAGFRGIGRMAGLSYCRRLVFETTDGSGQDCLVTFDAHAINKLTRPGQEPTTIAEAINDNCALAEQPSESETPFLQVSLEQVTNDALLDVPALVDYLERTAPVRHDPSVWKFEGKIRSFADQAGHAESLDTVSIRVCDPDGAVLREIYRPFKDSFTTRNANRKSPRRVDVADVVALPRSADYPGWWGWLALHKRQGALADVPFGGIRVRMHNIAVGDHSLLQPLWTTKYLALWCFGEIHITDPSLVPNSQRDDFEPSETLTRLHHQFREEMQRIERETRSESKRRNTSVPVIVKRAEGAAEEARKCLAEGLTSHNEKTRILQRLDKEADHLDDAIAKRNRPQDEKTVLHEALAAVQEVREDVHKVRRTDADATMSHLNKQARATVRTVLAVVKEELDDDQRFAVIEQRVLAALRPGRKEP